MSAHNKFSLRRLLRARRRALTGYARACAERRITATLARFINRRSAQYVAAYLPFDGEVDLSALIARHPRRFWLPVIRPQGSLQFRAARHLPRFDAPRGGSQRNRFGIVEPPRSAIKSARRMDLIVLPLVGFDAQGHRLGMGAGFYDRTLQYLRRPRPFLIGVAFACQQVSELPADPWDVPLDAIVTEHGLTRFHHTKGTR
ncbi:5-formyltetrahydrofolate cyclo-ligase [Halothiobacillus sp. DCM-1]|uniref:5-formyltetrahydrofolate cyclo-ligase n=1 Tax=Halothiobacillus sp. DCM-1 TaxID=3112558 RepID=UPI003251C9B0